MDSGPIDAIPSVKPPARVALLGASNLSLSLAYALPHLVGRFAGRDLSIYVAHGPGRSYGSEAGALWLRFKGLAGCGLIEALESGREAGGPRAETWALLTDVGNDILYRTGAERLVSWVEEITRRLLALGARVGITALPLESVEAIAALKYRLLRPVFFPFRPMALAEVIAQMRAIQARLGELARTPGVRVLPTRASWYGFDHFHLRRRSRAQAFGVWLDEVLEVPEADGGQPSRREDLALGLRNLPSRSRFRRATQYLTLLRRREPGVARTIAPRARLYYF